jgi:hypothetical protein
MAHDHHHGDRAAFYTEQLFSIGACGAFAGVTLLLWYNGVLKNLLAEKFHIWVVLGGVTLLVMAVVNSIAVWFSVGEAKAVPVNGHDHNHDHDHDHDHGHDHHHEHAHDHHHDHSHGHDHDHVHSHAHEHTPKDAGVQTAPTGAALAATGLKLDAPASPAVAGAAGAHDHGHEGHDHGWAPWRYAVLLLPVAIYFVVPLDALSSAGGSTISVDESALTASSDGQKGKNVDETITFQQLEMAALYPDNREYYQGKMVRLVGMCMPQDARHFTLRRLKISCCAADAVPLNAVILIDPKSTETLNAGRLQDKWVQVTGRVEFLPRAGGAGGFTTTLVLSPTADRPLDELVKEVPTPANPYLN